MKTPFARLAFLVVAGIAGTALAQAPQPSAADGARPVAPAGPNTMQLPPAPADAGETAKPAPEAQPAPVREPRPGRPRIGLVLSGGGARGAAHIGVLKVLEEMRIPVDCVAGTSMGSIVGAAYASGMTVPEMQAELKELNLAKLFNDEPPRQDVPIRRKQDDQNIFFGPEFGVKGGGISLPKGVVSGVALEAELRRLARIPGYVDFDKLPVPFRAVATDIGTGKMVVFDRGELATATRASMSVPGIVAPAEVGGKMLVDGGLTRNLPVDIARDTCADVVIAVNLGTPLMKQDEITSLLGVTTQMINILTEQNVQQSLASLKPEDILILPELGDFSAGDFDGMPKTVPIGEAAARKVADRLAKYSVPPEEYAKFAAARTAPVVAGAPVIDEIRVTGAPRVNQEVVVASMETKAGEPLDRDKIDADLRRIYGRGDFERVGYRVISEPGRNVLEIEGVQKSWGPDYLRFGLGLNTDFRGDAYFNLLASYRKSWLNSWGGEWRTDLQVGRNSFASTELYQPLDPDQYFFIAPRLFVNRDPVNIFSASNKVAQYDRTYYGAALDLGAQVTRYGELRLGVVRGGLDFTLDTGPAFFEPPESFFQMGGVNLRLYLDQLDSWRIPKQGWASILNTYRSEPGLGATNAYTRLDFSAVAAATWGPHTLQSGVRYSGPIGGSLPTYAFSQLGGFQQLSGYSTGQFYAQETMLGRIVYLYRLAEIPLFQGAYLGTSLETGRALGQLTFPPVVGPPNPTGWLGAGSVFLAVDTPVGPVYLAYGHSFDGANAAYFFLGRP
jgi:NTE family protein